MTICVSKLGLYLRYAILSMDFTIQVRCTVNKKIASSFKTLIMCKLVMIHEANVMGALTMKVT